MNADSEQSETPQWAKASPFDEKVTSTSATDDLKQDAGDETSLSSTNNLHPSGIRYSSVEEILSILRAREAPLTDSGFYPQDKWTGKTVGTVGNTSVGKSCVTRQLAQNPLLIDLTAPSPRLV